MGTVRKRGKGYVIDYYMHGRRVREPGGLTKKEAQEKLGKRLEEIRSGEYSGKRTIKHVRIDALVEEYLLHFTGKSIEAERIHINVIKKYFSGKFVSQITDHDVELFRAKRRSVLTKNKTERSAA